MEIDVSKCRFYLKDGSCYSMNEECTKCIHNYCDWKVNQEQLQQLKQENEEIRKINEANAKLMIKLRDCLDKIEELCNRYQTCRIVLKEDILQKIKEVKK